LTIAIPTGTNDIVITAAYSLLASAPVDCAGSTVAMVNVNAERRPLTRRSRDPSRYPRKGRRARGIPVEEYLADRLGPLAASLTRRTGHRAPRLRERPRRADGLRALVRRTPRAD